MFQFKRVVKAVFTKGLWSVLWLGHGLKFEQFVLVKSSAQSVKIDQKQVRFSGGGGDFTQGL